MMCSAGTDVVSVGELDALIEFSVLRPKPAHYWIGNTLRGPHGANTNLRER
jgi:hypothetical protein